MALTYLAGDFGDLTLIFNPENKYPACAGVSFEFGILSILYFHEKPQTVDTAPPGIGRFFQKMGQSTQAKYKTVRATISDEVESLTLLSQEMFKDKTQEGLLATAGFLTLGPLGILAGKAAGKKGEAVFAIKFSETASDPLVRGKKLVVQATAKEYEALAKASSSKRLKDIGAAFLAEPEQPPANGGNDSVSELEKLVSMKEKGLLSDEEFTAAKAKLLGL